jgi:hypothetical protein
VCIIQGLPDVCMFIYPTAIFVSANSMPGAIIGLGIE